MFAIEMSATGAIWLCFMYSHRFSLLVSAWHSISLMGGLLV